MAATAPAPFLDTLNPEQRRAALHGVVDGRLGPCGPLLVIAGAGTGKTSTLAHRVAVLLLQGVPAERILLMTFSRRAAQELQRRAEGIVARAGPGGRAGERLAASARRLWSGTFHAVGHRLLREYAPALGLEADFSVLDRGDAADLIDVLRTRAELPKVARRFPRKDTCLAIYSHRVNTGGTLQDTLEHEFPWCAEWADELKGLFRAYVQAKQRQALLDYDDLLLYWHVLAQEPALAREVGARFDHVLVDEYQDTNVLQADILHALVPDGAGLCVVGDDAQAIYSFRAATVDNILSFPRRFEPPAAVVTLDRNYRSVQPVLDTANALMGEAADRYEKHLRSAAPSEQKPRYVLVEDEQAQAEYVVEQVLARREAGTALRAQAVLLRKAHDSDRLEVELTRRGIPFVKYGGLKFLEAAHVKDVLSILRFVDNPRHRLAGFRTLQLLPGIGPTTAERLLDRLEAHGGTLDALREAPVPAAARADWPALVDLLLTLAGAEHWAGQMTRVRAWYEPHLERLHGNAQVRAGDLEQLEALAPQHGDRSSFVTELTLDPPQATGDEADAPHRDEDYLILSTVHSAKGQEWDAVHVLNVVDGTFPNEFAADRPERIEEERRLLYVAVTRARRELDLIAPLRFYVTQQRRFGERHLYGARSRFLTDAVMDTLEQSAWPCAGDAAPTPSAATTVRIDAAAQLRALWDE
jgi:DNA helicase-2/ATP-dependent DNA helicase PcrA